MIVLLSGGLDSATCLYWAIDKFGAHNVETVTFDYGQKHKVEIEAAYWVSDVAGVSNQVIKISSLDTGGMVVPGRNIIFLTYAANISNRIVIGVSKSDYEDFPDCRPETISATERALSLSTEIAVTIESPLIHLTKKDVVLLAVELGVPIGLTHSCYLGAPPCGVCLACVTRAKGFSEAGINDLHG